MSNNLSKKIITTIIYYDILDYPLNSFEIWKYLINDQEAVSGEQEKNSLGDVIEELENNKELKKHIGEHQGFYVVKERKELVDKRIERNKISERKIKIIKKAAWSLRFVPYIRMIAVTGRMAMKNADRSSDLDLLIVLKKGRIFTGRILATFLVHLLGVRRYGNKIKDRICLNHFMTDRDLKTEIHDLFLSSENSSALHLFASSEYSFIYPVFGWEIFQRFQKENSWIRKYKINYQFDEAIGLKLIEDPLFSKVIRKAGEFVFNFGYIEKALKKWQMNRIISDPRTHQLGSFVTANDHELIFLPEPQGPEIYEKFRDRLNKIANL